MMVNYDLKTLFGQNNPNPKAESIFKITSMNDLALLRITSPAYAKIKAVVKTAFDVKRHAVESYWFLLGDPVTGIILDILVPRQSISTAYVEVNAKDLLGLQKEIANSDLIVLGWGHSHADFGVFFSGTDINNQARVFYETSNYALLKDGDTSFQRVKYSYGSTFNIHGDKYGELTWQVEGDGSFQHRKIPLKILDTENNSEPLMEHFIGQIRSLFL